MRSGAKEAYDRAGWMRISARRAGKVRAKNGRGFGRRRREWARECAAKSRTQKSGSLASEPFLDLSQGESFLPRTRIDISTVPRASKPRLSRSAARGDI